MSKNSDFFFLNLKQLYPNFAKPSPLDVEIWEEMLNQHTPESMHKALKAYRQSERGNYIPTPAHFKEYLTLFKPIEKPEEDGLPDRPAAYLMDQDIASNRRKYFFHTYNAGVNYVLNKVLLDTIGEAEFCALNYRQRYRRAVDLGLFGNFEEILDYVYENGAR